MSRFDNSYDGAPPPWDIGRPQKAFVRLEAEGEITGPVLDAGCGTGEHALYFASRGHQAVGVDIVPAAIERARAKAAARGLAATFVVGDVLQLEKLDRVFHTIVDCGVFHVFDDAERARYVDSLARALPYGGHYHMLVFSDAEPADWGGPRRISSAEIEAAFAVDWIIRRLEPARVETTFHPEPGGHAWLATVERVS